MRKHGEICIIVGGQSFCPQHHMIGLVKILKSYYLQEFRNKDTYTEFIKFMLSHSDFFSLIYFKYRENERMKHKTKNIYNNLKKFKKYSQNTQKWPNTETNDKDHFYKIIFYRSDIKCLDSLLQVDDIYDWDYPDAPMDLCFYKDGYCWLAITSHEHMAFLYNDNKAEVETLKDLGADLTFCGEEEVIFCYELYKRRPC